LALLLGQGMDLVEALHAAAATVDNTVLRTLLEDIKLDVQAGSSLSQAFMSYDITSYDAQVAALIGLAHESGSLTPMLLKASELYQIKAQRILTVITTLIQPFLLLILGILIAALIFAIYMPLIDLSYAV
jgi:type II secretory pathway component PulF